MAAMKKSILWGRRDFTGRMGHGESGTRFLDGATEENGWSVWSALQGQRGVVVDGDGERERVRCGERQPCERPVGTYKLLPCSARHTPAS